MKKSDLIKVKIIDANNSQPAESALLLSIKNGRSVDGLDKVFAWAFDSKGCLNFYDLYFYRIVLDDSNHLA